MSSVNLIPLLPLLTLAVTIVIVLLTAAFSQKHLLSLTLTLIGLAASFATLFRIPIPASVTTLLMVDGYAAYYMGLILSSAFGITLFSYDYLRTQKEEHFHEYYLELLLATLGSMVLVASNHFASFFLALEILSVSLYVLISYRRKDSRALEAGAKYLVLGGTSSAFLLFGMALVYASLGTMEFSRMGSQLAKNPDHEILTLVGTAMLLVGIGFKLALAPFHLWSPDIYEGASAPVTGFVATISKGAMFALLLRFFFTIDFHPSSGLPTLFALLSIASMFIGNWTALRQNNIKRLLAYSSIAHLGYLLVALLAGAQLGANAIAFYLLTYFVTTLTAFGVISVLSQSEKDADQILDYQGLFWNRPGLAVIFTCAILSLAGIPLTAGFMGKLYLISTGVSSALWVLVLILVLNSAIGLYYYLRLIFAMLSPGLASLQTHSVRIALPSGSVLAVLSILLIWMGVYPSPVLHFIQNTIPLWVR